MIVAIKFNTDSYFNPTVQYDWTCAGVLLMGMLHSTLHLLCKAVSCPNNAARCALRNSYRSSVMWQFLFHLNKNQNINKFHYNFWCLYNCLPELEMSIEAVYILKSLFAVRTPHTVFTFVFVLLCNECTLMPSRHNLQYIDWTMHLYMFQCPKVNTGGFTVKC